eukprot:2501905-Rhodomonas_salina.1
MRRARDRDLGGVVANMGQREVQWEENVREMAERQEEERKETARAVERMEAAVGAVAGVLASCDRWPKMPDFRYVMSD